MKSCFKGKGQQTASGSYYSRCRYGFGRPPRDVTTLNSAKEATKSRRTGEKVKKMYDLRRAKNEAYINDYNPILLLAWECNIDVQFTGEVTRVLDMYITGYIAKPETHAAQVLLDATGIDPSASSTFGTLKSILCKSLGTREVGANECADRVLGHPTYRSSDAVAWLGVGLPENRRRKLVCPKLAELDKLPDDATQLFCNNFLDNYYLSRPDVLEKMCLFELFSEWERTPINVVCSNILWNNNCSVPFKFFVFFSAGAAAQVHGREAGLPLQERPRLPAKASRPKAGQDAPARLAAGHGQARERLLHVPAAVRAVARRGRPQVRLRLLQRGVREESGRVPGHGQVSSAEGKSGADQAASRTVAPGRLVSC